MNLTNIDNQTRIIYQTMKTARFIMITVISMPLHFCQAQFTGTRIVSEYGNENCIELYNETTRVVLEPNLGGRVLIYELNGNNILWINAKNEGNPYIPGENYGLPSAGRFDIGPEMTGPRSTTLFFGTWKGKITGPRTATLISQEDTFVGVQLIRTFTLDDNGSHLTCTQVIKNVGNEIKHHYFWARTFAEGGGISLIPMNPHSRYPKGYLIYGPGAVLDFRPADEPNIRVSEGVLEILGPPARPKFVMDCSEGWLAYISLDNQLYIKRFPIYEDRNYGDIAGNTVSIWYNKDLQCEIEPMGPMEIIEPGREASFTEHWYLFDYKYPDDRKADLEDIRARIAACTMD